MQEASVNLPKLKNGMFSDFICPEGSFLASTSTVEHSYQESQFCQSLQIIGLPPTKVNEIENIRVIINFNTPATDNND